MSTAVVAVVMVVVVRASFGRCWLFAAWSTWSVFESGLVLLVTKRRRGTAALSTWMRRGATGLRSVLGLASVGHWVPLD